MQSSDSPPLPIERIEPYQGRRTLGVRLAADGNNREEVAYLRQCLKEWADRLHNGHLPRHLAWRALASMLWPKLCYPLPATTLSHTECKHIMAPALQAGLATSGMVGSLPRALAHGPVSSGGLGLADLYHEQGWRHLSTALRHGSDADSNTGKLLRISLQHLYLELGMPGSPFKQDFSLFRGLTTDSWIATLWKSLWEHDMAIGKVTFVHPLPREHDEYLIAGFVRLGFRGGDLQAIN